MNDKLVKIFFEISEILKTQEDSFRALAYQRAGEEIEGMDEDIKNIYRQGKIKAIKEIPGIGESLALKIEEFIKTGKIKFYDELKKELPVNLEEIVAVEGMGYKKAKILYKKLKIRNIKDLEKAAKMGKIKNIVGFGEKSEKNILEGIEFLKRDKGRFLLGEILPIAVEIEKKLSNLKEVKKVSMAGSFRRRKETIGDLDFLVVSDFPKKVADFFVSLPGVVKIWGMGAKKCSVRFNKGFDADLRIVREQSFGAALQYFTGSVEHNIAMRKIAISKGLKLNEYGVFNKSSMVAGKTEDEVYSALGLKIIPPELRENQGEIEADLSGKLPVLVLEKDIKGDLHCHSNWDGGDDSIEEMAKTAMMMGYEYIGISDHTKFLRIENGLDEKELLSQKKEIEKINIKYKDRFRILHGCEANIMKDGSLDIKDEVLRELDYVIAGVHSYFKMSKEEMTDRLIKVMKNPYVSIISHPTGRILKRRDEYAINFEKIFEIARETKTIFEINSAYERLDLKDIYIRKAKEFGVKMVVNTDSHNKDQLKTIGFGISQARRGWAEKGDIINTKDVDSLIKILKK